MKQILRVATYEEFEYVMVRVTFEQIVDFLKSTICQEDVVETYGARPWVTDGDYIKDYVAEHNDNLFQMIPKICYDLNKDAQFYDWILRNHPNGY
jgi:hypothetical protein